MILLTDSSDMKSLEELGWTIDTYNIPAAVIEPPTISLDVRSAEPEEVANPGLFRISERVLGRKISSLTHRNLLHQSLRDYSDIWRILAER